ncbi:HNH endonuclease signature motif containing protein [Amycolatopsis sp. NPDC050768]|uniref:HNH endonuclease n=1 Tax=Amycolatopsis sp. NPDC050768 TaxID=3154839 RepID=UPI0033EA3028
MTDVDAVRSAMRELDHDGQADFLARHEFGDADQYYARAGARLYPAKAIAGVAYGYQFRDRGTLPHGGFSGGQAGANRVLRQLGFDIIDTRPDTIAGERVWREAVYAHLRDLDPDGHGIEPGAIRSFGAYGGGQGVWVDSARTRDLDSRGITVAVLNTGRHYADVLTDEDALYHYPNTNRPSGRDHAEVEATKAAGEHTIPVFVISPAPTSGARRTVRLGWVGGWDDNSELFLITFTPDAPDQLLDTDSSDEEGFQLRGNNRRRRTREVVERPGQNTFKLRVFQRYGARCPLSGVAVPEMLEAAHLVPYAADGSDDPRNGLPLNAALHRAFDAHLFGIDPDTHDVVTKPGGPGLADLGITTPTIRGLVKLPHHEALAARYEEWRSKQP